MTLKAFAHKYKVPLPIVREASINVPTVATMDRDHDFLEQNLYGATLHILCKRRNKARELSDRYDEMIQGVMDVGRH